VEDSFSYAKRTLEESHPNRVPMMSDGIEGDLVLGDHDFSAASSRQATWRTAPQESSTYRSAHAPTSARNGSDDEPEPSPTPAPRRKGNVGVCGKFAYNCSSDD
jgi:hypothetical protein